MKNQHQTSKSSVTSNKSAQSKNTQSSKQSKRDKSSKPSVKAKGLHPRNRHKNGYDFPKLIANYPKLKSFVALNPYGNLSIDFGSSDAVKALNAALLKSEYQVESWDIPQGFLCPPVPGRVDYLHYLADLLASGYQPPKIPKGRKVSVLDVGTGANGIYPLLGTSEYGWRFVASDIDPVSLENLASIRDANPSVSNSLALRHQAQSSQVFKGVIKDGERFDLTMCNPPFHASLEEALQGNQRKVDNLAANRAKRTGKGQVKAESKLNFGGQKAELWCDGGERRFLQTMIKESQAFANQCLWFTSLVSKKENLQPCQAWLTEAKASQVKVIEMAQGNKLTRVIAWSFLNGEQRRLWSQFKG